MTSDNYERTRLVTEVRLIETAAVGRELTATEAARLAAVTCEINRLDADAEADEGWLGD